VCDIFDFGECFEIVEAKVEPETVLLPQLRLKRPLLRLRTVTQNGGIKINLMSYYSDIGK
jgi:hypothetical protein